MSTVLADRDTNAAIMSTHPELNAKENQKPLMATGGENAPNKALEAHLKDAGK
jgi:hypothetical protein